MTKSIKKCPHCHQEYYEVYETYGSVDEKRETYITCPYCKEVVEQNIRLSKCEEIWTTKIEDIKEEQLR